MKKYLIQIEVNGNKTQTIVNGDLSRPFSINGNLWNYATPWTAARRLEILARSCENCGASVKRTYGTVEDMPTKGNDFNVAVTKWEYGAKKEFPKYRG